MAKVISKSEFDDMDAVQLNDWYQREIGYRPQDDEPSITLLELRMLCKFVAEPAFA